MREREREEERVRMAPNMEGGGSHLQAMSDPEEGEMTEGEQQCNEEKGEILKLVRGLNLNDNETQKSMKQNSKNMRYNSMRKMWHADRKQNRNHKEKTAGSSPRICRTERRNSIDITAGEYSISDYDVSKKLIHLLRHGKPTSRQSRSNLLELWRIKDNPQNKC